MTESTRRPKAIVLGAGFTGLVTAYALERRGFSVEVHERIERAGGLLGTVRTEFGLAESAANAFINSARVEALFADLGIPIVPAKRESRARYIFRGGFRRWPIGFGASLMALGFLFRFLFARGSLRPRSGETVGAWGRRTLGEEATEYFLLPALQGIYAGEGRRLSATLVIGPMFAPRKGRPPRIRGSVTAPGGMAEVVTKLQAKLEERGVVFHFRSSGPAKGSEELTYYAGSARQTAEALLPNHPELVRLLGRIETLPLVSVTAFFPRDQRARPGFGVLFPPREGFRSLGVLQNHDIFPDRVRDERTLSETWILGGARRPEIAGLEEREILKEILADRKHLYGFGEAGEAPIHYALHRWPTAIPYYTIELESLLSELRAAAATLKHVRLVGNYLGGIGLTKILNSVNETVDREAKE